MASVASQLIEEVTAHAQSDSLEDAGEICADGTYFPNNLRGIPNCWQEGNVEKCVESSTFDRVLYLCLDKGELRIVKNTVMNLRYSQEEGHLLANSAAVML